ncbi:toxin HicA [Corynebacterium liangguodongii]|uniref:Toxin HicA n=1 Tax=Corynebacterium liangguodongii TaxID=2079535 RepID=A0A2S0WEH5_9CORY|nr:toxin HicA [Corynebacterium liangguodongii]AWB84183.1 toxin HicA [Corynebacterium liangguodongii]PWC00194.1 toxin HicA [Corynebacterium liangguodongii]
MRTSPTNVSFSDLEKVCDHFFERRSSRRGSHVTYKTPWIGNPRVNIQNAGGEAKPYQVRQVLSAIDRLKEM